MAQSQEVPSDLNYSSEHEWVRLDGEEAVIGITHFAQDQLGDVVYVELPKKGASVVQFKTFGVVESVKTASDLYSPLSGEILEVNESLVNQPELVNQAPYSEGWIIRVKLRDKAEMDNLLTAEQYQDQISKEQ